MTQKIQQQTKQKNYCRICLQDSQILKKLPCACKGSLSYMHDRCINAMMHIKIQNQKQDVPDYIQVLSNEYNNQQIVKAKCEICLHEIFLERQSKLSWEKLTEIQMEIYFVLFGISCLSVLGWNIALILLSKALEQSKFIIRILYLAAYFWIIGVILYVMLQPLYSEIKVTVFKIKNASSLWKSDLNMNETSIFLYYYHYAKSILQKLMRTFRRRQRSERILFDKKVRCRSLSRSRINKKCLNNQYAGKVLSSGKILYFEV